MDCKEVGMRAMGRGARRIRTYRLDIFVPIDIHIIELINQIFLYP